MSDFSPLLQKIFTTYKSFFDLFISNSEIQLILNGLLNYNNYLIEPKRTYGRKSQFLIQKNPSIVSAMPLTLALEQHHSKKNQFGKTEVVSANSRLFSTTELSLSTILRECSAIIYALSEYEFHFQGSKHPMILYIDHKPILFLFTQKNKPNHRVYNFQ